jgi:preprotein translocase subunit SecF
MRRLRLLPDGTHIPFFRYRWFAYAWSAFLLVGTVVLLATVGLNLGIDFKGGILIEVRTAAPADLATMRSRLNALGFGDVSLQDAGSDRDVMIRIAQPEGGEAAAKAVIEQVRATLDEVAGPDVEYRRSEFVGPRVSRELFIGGIWALLISLGGVLLYLWFRFEWQYGAASITTLTHDVSGALGIYALFQLEFNLTALAALLTIVGYSLNDNVVIYDRIRENLRRYKVMPIPELLDKSINETLARTVATATTTLLALVALWLFGGDVIRDFTTIMIWGVLTGTYATTFVAPSVLYYLNLRAIPEKDVKAAAQPAE